MEKDNHICAYCGKEAKFQLKNGKWCCCKFSTQCLVNRQKNSVGVKNSQIDYKNRYNNMSEEARERMKWNKGLTKQTSQIIKKFGQTLHKKYQNGQLIHSWTNRHHTKEQKDKIIYGMIHSRKIGKGFKSRLV